MGIRRLCFGPYNYQQLQEITSRFKKKMLLKNMQLNLLQERWQLFLVMLVVHWRFVGELQKLQIIALKAWHFPTQTLQVIRSCSKLRKIFLAAMVHELYKTGMGETNFEKLAVTVSCFCSSNGELFPVYDTLLKVGCKLGECRILLCESGAKHKLQLNYPSDDVTFALKDSKTCLGWPSISNMIDRRSYAIFICVLFPSKGLSI